MENVAFSMKFMRTNLYKNQIRSRNANLNIDSVVDRSDLESNQVQHSTECREYRYFEKNTGSSDPCRFNSTKDFREASFLYGCTVILFNS